MAWRHNYQNTDPLFIEEVVELLGGSRSQTREHLRSLRAANLITWNTNRAYQYIFYFSQHDLVDISTQNTKEEIRGKDESEKPENRTCDESEKPENRTCDESEKPENRTRSGKLFSISGIPVSVYRGEQGKNSENLLSQPTIESVIPEKWTLEEVKEDSINLNSSSNLEYEIPDSGLILAAVPDLFGEPILGPPSRYPNSRLLLAHVAEAYDKRKRIKYPARVAYKNLEKSIPPEFVYFVDPAAFLPPEFLNRLGMIRAQTSPPVDLESEEVSKSVQIDVEPDPSVNQQVTPLGPTASNAWNSATNQLQFEMPKATYKTWVEPTRLAQYDPITNTFIIATPNDYAREWLQSRLTSTLVRLLTGICNRSVSIQFIFFGVSSP